MIQSNGWSSHWDTIPSSPEVPGLGAESDFPRSHGGCGGGTTGMWEWILYIWIPSSLASIANLCIDIIYTYIYIYTYVYIYIHMYIYIYMQSCGGSLV